MCEQICLHIFLPPLPQSRKVIVMFKSSVRLKTETADLASQELNIYHGMTRIYIFIFILLGLFSGRQLTGSHELLHTTASHPS
jgi:hypothetical protein